MMSSIPESLEEYLAWVYGVPLSTNLLSYFEEYREAVERHLDNFDEETQSWRDYGQAMALLIPKRVWDQAEKLRYTANDEVFPILQHLSISEYEEWMRDNTKYPPGLTYPAGGMAAESGELMNDILRLQRKYHRLNIETDDLDPRTWIKMIAEAGDVLAYLTMLAGELGVSLTQIAHFNQKKIIKKKSDGAFYRTEVDDD